MKLNEQATAIKKARLIRRTTVEDKTGLPRSSIYEKIAKNEFPKPIKLGGARAVAWVESQVDDWINDRINEADR